MKTRIMYIENKSAGDRVTGRARIGRVRYSKSGRSLYYDDLMFQSLSGQGYKANYFETESSDEYWISGCKKDGGDRLYAGIIEIDEEVREEYWTEIRNAPEQIECKLIHCKGKY
ncbi:MAG: 1-deoxy-D-xylulose-5-phosphate synthase [Pseudomonadota bacterium]